MFVNARRKAYKAMGQFHSMTSFITDIFNVIILIAGGLFLYNGAIDFGDYSAFIVSVNLFISPVNTLIGFMEQFQNGVSGFRRFVEIMEETPETDAPDAIALENVKGEIEFKNVSYAYDTTKEVLHDIDLKLEKGRKLALVGPSGGGKTTLCNLIPRFYELDEGSISIDGIDITDISRYSLRKNIGIVAQDVFLFSGTVRENIAYGNLDATEEEIIEAAKRANIHDYIMTLEKGYDTKVGERGINLSGGQKQRISIARVFLKNPPILILDEATSALDNVTEMQIQASLEDLAKGRTVIVVAHRLSTIQNADEILVINQDGIAERGSHESLLAKNGIYAGLYNRTNA
jgi:ATP-binding cassette subfamily B protein